MIKKLTVRGYRCFKEFRMSRLAMVNLLVGKNNTGKTALLEAIELLSSPVGEPDRLWAPLSRRGERFTEDDEQARRDVEYDVSHLFHGHIIDVGASFEIIAEAAGPVQLVRGEIVVPEPSPERELFADDEDNLDREGRHVAPIALKLKSGDPEMEVSLPLTSRGGLRRRMLLPFYRRPTSEDRARQSTFVTTASLSAYIASQYWKSVALTVEEELVIQALEVLEKNIERIAFVGVPRPYDWREGPGGFLVKCRGSDEPVPIGSLGDGMWRMFCIAIALIRARGGILLVDEIDTGLHYAVMEDMWSLVLQTAERLSVQVFATTHSSDCINSLAGVCRRGRPEQAGIQRIEPGNPEGVAYSEEEIWTAAQHGIEMR